MELSPSEIKFAEKYIQRLERYSRKWPANRWFGLFAGIFMIGTSALSYFYYPSALDFTVSSDYTLLGKEYDPQLVELFVSKKTIRYFVEIYEMLFDIINFVGFICGLSIISYVMLNWNKHIKNRILAKAFKKILSQQ